MPSVQLFPLYCRFEMIHKKSLEEKEFTNDKNKDMDVAKQIIVYTG